ncbi:MAG: DNA-formamidopyrimidine glycosylase family protein, partial [Gemmatimonadales bacterium]
MPELPEVETIVRELRPRLVGRNSADARLSHDNVLDGASRRLQLRERPGRSISAVTRRARHALIHTDTKILAVQPGMTGALRDYNRKLRPPEIRYAVLRCRLASRLTLVYRDSTGLARWRWLTARAWDNYQNRPGPGPLDPALTAERFAARLARSRAAIMKVLMDQRLIVGVGNSYASEALFAAGIDPSKAAKAVPREQRLALHRHVQRILRAAIERDPSTYALDSHRMPAPSIPEEFESVLRRHVLEVWFPRCLDRVHGGFLCDFDHTWRSNGPDDKLLEFQA